MRGRRCSIFVLKVKATCERKSDASKYSFYRLISFTNFNAQFLHSITICMLHYNPRHVWSINMPIFRRTNCIITASVIITLFKRLCNMPDESRLLYVCYITILDMFGALTCPSSGGQIVLSQHLLSSLSVKGCAICRMRADCPMYVTLQSSTCFEH